MLPARRDLGPSWLNRSEAIVRPPPQAVPVRPVRSLLGATGIYREKVYDLLSEAGLDVKVVNARHVKQLKGRKIGAADSV